MAENWRPTASRETLQQRAEILAGIRDFFSARDVLEVETPMLSPAATTEPHLESLAVVPLGWLHTSPEYPMKRLLAAGFGDCYQICRVFRGTELGRRHQPEFTLLEWYRVGWDWQQLQTEVAELLAGILGVDRVESHSYAELFLADGLDIETVTVKELQAGLTARGIVFPDAELHHDAWLDLWISTVISPKLGQGCLSFVHSYPASQASLAHVEQGVAQRFEVYYQGIELGNGFQEETDPEELRRRFYSWNELRVEEGLKQMPIDETFLAAMTAGLPLSAGVAVGVDRLVMLALGAVSLDEVMAFGGRG